MDFDRLTENMNTRTVFREPRGMSRWVQLLFAIIAFTTVTGFYTEMKIDVICPNATEKHQVSLGIQYPFSMGNKIDNPCNFTTSQTPYSYTATSGLTGSPQFFVMTGVLSLLYAFTSIVGYLLFSQHYESVPLLPLVDLISTLTLAIFWFVASCSFASGVSFLKHTVTFPAIQQAFCPPNVFTAANSCEAIAPVWRSLNVAIIAGFTSFFLWGAGTWFVFKETTLHTPRDQFRQTIP